MNPANALQPAYLLHRRPFRDTSLLIDLFTQDQGRIAAVAKGARSMRSRWRGVLQPFAPLWVRCVGKTDLLTLTAAEPYSMPHLLEGQALLSGFYLNELLTRLLQRADPYVNLYAVYERTMQKLQHCVLQQELEIILRGFERDMLRELGYELVLDRESKTHLPILADQFYHYEPHYGLIRATQESHVITSEKYMCFLGANLLALHQNDFQDVTVLRDAKRLMRAAIATLLGDKPLCSRELFQAMG